MLRNEAPTGTHGAAADTTPHVEGDAAAQPGVDDGKSRSQERIERLSQERNELRDKLADERVARARAEGAREEAARRPPAAQPEFDSESERLEYLIKEQGKQVSALEAQLKTERSSRAKSTALDRAKKGLNFGDLEADEESYLVNKPLEAALSDGKSPEAVRRLATNISRRLNPNAQTGRGQKASPQGQAYVDSKAGDASATRRVAPASSSAPPTGTKPQTLAQKQEANKAKLAAAMGRKRAGATG